MGSKWTALKDDKGRTYYWNESTHETCWERPACMEHDDDGFADLFHNLDTNTDGVLSFEEFTSWVTGVTSVTRDDAKAYFDFADADGDRTISSSEFVSFCQHYRAHIPALSHLRTAAGGVCPRFGGGSHDFAGEVRALFATVDKNCDGVVSFVEFRGWAPSLGIAHNDIEEFFAFADADGDKMISQNEFQDFCEHYRAHIPALRHLQTEESLKNDEELHLQAKNGITEEVKRLLAARADPNGFKDWDSNTALHEAAHGGHAAVAALLVGARGDVNALTSFGHAPLHTASNGGYADIVEILLAAKCDVNVSGRNKWSALHVACSEGFLAIAVMLADAGADVKAQTAHGETPLSLALEHKRGEWGQVEKVLRERGAQ